MAGQADRLFADLSGCESGGEPPQSKAFGAPLILHLPSFAKAAIIFNRIRIALGAKPNAGTSFPSSMPNAP